MNVRDLASFGAAVGTFAFAITVHVAVVAGLASRTPRWRVPVALLVPPLAPVFAFRVGMRRRAGLWCAAFLGYAVALAFASR